MPLSAALLALAPAALAPAPAPAPEWCEGPLERVLARSAAEQRLVLVELRTDWERDCARLGASLASEVAAAELKDMLCLSLDAESPAGALLAYERRVAIYPTLLFLEPDGTLRERLQGYSGAAHLAAELARIARNEGTVKALVDALAAAPDDLDLRYELALKLERAGDRQAGRAELAEISRRDPEGRSRASRRMAFDAVQVSFLETLVKWEEPDWDGLLRLTEELGDPELEFRGLAMLGYAHDIEGVRARNRKKLEEVQPHLTQSRAFYARAWQLVPEASVAAFGNELAWNFWEDAENLTPEEKALAVAAAERACAALPDDTSVMDTLACCYFMNGEVARAREVVARCRELDPARASQWDEREALFAAE